MFTTERRVYLRRMPGTDNNTNIHCRSEKIEKVDSIPGYKNMCFACMSIGMSFISSNVNVSNGTNSVYSYMALND